MNSKVNCSNSYINAECGKVQLLQESLILKLTNDFVIEIFSLTIWHESVLRMVLILFLKLGIYSFVKIHEIKLSWNRNGKRKKFFRFKLFSTYWLRSPLMKPFNGTLTFRLKVSNFKSIIYYYIKDELLKFMSSYHRRWTVIIAFLEE